LKEVFIVLLVFYVSDDCFVFRVYDNDVCYWFKLSVS